MNRAAVKAGERKLLLCCRFNHQREVKPQPVSLVYSHLQNGAEFSIGALFVLRVNLYLG